MYTHRVNLIVAMDQNQGIGIGDKLPWRLPADMAHFKTTTINGGNGIVVMGRKTWCSIPAKFRPLPERENVIVTKNPEFIVPFAPNVVIAHSVPEVLWICRNRRFYVIGGEEIYNLFMPIADRLVVTHIDTYIESCNKFFPSMDGDWERQRKLLDHPADEKNQYSFKVLEYTRKPRIL